jgi:hypothetical protein
VKTPGRRQENAFGEPTETAKGTEGFKNYACQLNNVQIVHYVFDRFGPEEHMRIKRAKGSPNR